MTKKIPLEENPFSDPSATQAAIAQVLQPGRTYSANEMVVVSPGHTSSTQRPVRITEMRTPSGTFQGTVVQPTGPNRLVNIEEVIPERLDRNSGYNPVEDRDFTVPDSPGTIEERRRARGAPRHRRRAAREGQDNRRINESESKRRKK